MKTPNPALVAATLCLAGGVHAGEREDAVAALETIASAPGLETWVNSGDETEIALGEPVTFHFRAAEDGYLTVIYLDAHGAATVLFPTGDTATDRIRAGEDKRFPPRDAGFSLTSQLPLGSETVFALTTREPLTRQQLGLPSDPGDLPVVEAADVPALAKKLGAIASKAPAGSVRVARFDQTVINSAETSSTQYTSRGIVRYFTERHRSIKRPKLDLNIQFEFGSDRLTADAKRDLDEVGSALNDPRLQSRSFLLAGHTDDVGDAGFNQALSEKRAKAARSYLVERHGVAAERLETEGFGEAQPLVPGQNDAARAKNRRVVLELVR